MNYLHLMWIAVLPWLPGVLFAAVTVTAMYFFNKNKTDTNYIKTALAVLHTIFGDKLGSKADAVFDIWIECLDKVKNGTWTQEQMLTEFFRIIEETGPVQLTDTEVADIKQLTDTSVKLLSVKGDISLMSVM